MNPSLIISVLLASIFCVGCQSNSSKSREDECIAYEWQADQSIKDGNFKKAEQLYQLALEKAKSGDNALQVPVVLQEQAELFRMQNKFTEAEHCLRDSLAAYAAINKKATPDSKQLLTGMKLQQGAVHTLEKLANTLEDENHPEEAAKYYKEALTTNKAAGGQVDDTVRIANSFTKLLRKLHRNAEAEDIENEADSANFVTIEIGPRLWDQIAIFDRDGAQYTASLHKFKTIALVAKRFGKMQIYCLAKRYQGLAEFALSQTSQAENSFREDVQGTNSLVSDPRFKQECASELSVLASFLFVENKKMEAAALLKKAMSLDVGESRGAIVHFITICCQSGHLNSGNSLCEELEKLAAQTANSRNEKYDDVIYCYVALSDRYRVKHDYRNYDSVVTRASQLYLKSGKPAGKVWTELLARQGEANYYLGRTAIADQQLKKVIALSATKPPDVSVGNSFHYLGELCAAQNQRMRSFEYYTQACAIFEYVPELSECYIRDLVQLITMNIQKGKLLEANSMCKHGLKFAEAKEPAQVPGILNIWGLCFRHRHEYATAEKLQLRALELVQKLYGPGSNATASTLNQLADLYLIQGKYSQATHYLEKALAVYHDSLPGKYPEMESALQSELKAAKNKEPWPAVKPPGITIKNSP